MLEVQNKVPRFQAAGLKGLPDDVLASTTPIVLEGLAADWPLVQAGKRSADDAIEYMRGFYENATVGVFIGDPEEGGRVFYSDNMAGFNYQPQIETTRRKTSDGNPESLLYRHLGL